MSETRNIVVVGASFGGLGAAHYICKHIFPKLQQSKDARYVLHLIDPSTHFWWHIAAPRQIVSVKELTIEKSFVPIRDGFKQYPNLQDSIVFTQASATALNTQDRKLTITKADGSSETLDYYALVIATGVKTPTPLTGFHGNYTTSEQALKDMNAKLASAKEVVISGGGPIGVETAGEIATQYGGKAKITLIAGGDKLLPVFNKSRAQKAQKLLEKIGVEVVYGVKATGKNDTADGKTEVLLDNGKSMTADVYIPAYGVTPNTDWLPEELKGNKGYVATNAATLRVDKAGPRVYAAGDVAGVDKGGVMAMYATIPILGSNIAHDLLEEAKLGTSPEKKYAFKEAETQLVPVGPKTGVAAFNGWGMPGFAVGFIKGKDYMIGFMNAFTEGKKF
ncbi:Oxidoreductase phnG [Pseudocercospora fuligena]|uniref:Oxidoreductase phnG n=1 Tax=Pseudocercospora fuligena TaxID=685502 RepID=A0A8H6VC03_9PEZI|nr:Oxidoreductase phnG [Pseudocercospora fuligena]